MNESMKLNQKGHNVKICREDLNSYHDGIHASKMLIRNTEHTKMAKKQKKHEERSSDERERMLGYERGSLKYSAE